MQLKLKSLLSENSFLYHTGMENEILYKNARAIADDCSSQSLQNMVQIFACSYIIII
jgi:hypothetical protein